MHINNFKEYLCISLKNCHYDLLEPITHDATVLLLTTTGTYSL